jgi:hypothetical protein
LLAVALVTIFQKEYNKCPNLTNVRNEFEQNG